MSLPSTGPDRRIVIPLAALAGVAFDLLALGPPPGLGLSISLAIMLSTIRLGGARHHWSMPAAIGLAMVPSWRSSPPLIALALITIMILVAIYTHPETAPLERWTLGAYFRAGLGLIPGAAVGFAGAVRWVLRLSRNPSAKKGLATIRGLALAAVVGTVFTILFASADPIFQDGLLRVLDFDFSLTRLVRASLVIPGVSAVTLGWATWRHRNRTARTALTSTIGGQIEALIVTVSVNLIFAGFLYVQFAYLFFGEVGRAGLGHAEYARRGFFELVTVTALVMGLILTVDWLVQHGSRHRTLDVMHVLLVGQTLVVTASALIRMDAYTDQFGLTRLRLFTTVFMVWTGVLLVWLTLTVLRAARDRFAFGALVSGLAIVIGLMAVNPDGIISSVNLRRAVTGAELDVDYLVSLGNDAVPSAVENLETLPKPTRSAVIAALLSREAEVETDWRSWSLSDRSAMNATASLTTD